MYTFTKLHVGRSVHEYGGRTKFGVKKMKKRLKQLTEKMWDFLRLFAKLCDNWINELILKVAKMTLQVTAGCCSL